MGCTTSCFGFVASTSNPPPEHITKQIDAAASSSASEDIDLTSVPPTMPRGRIQSFNGPAIKQSFSLPESIIYYIAKNPSSAKGYLKMAQSCKFFFEKNSIIIASRIHGDSKICSKTPEECERNKGKCCVDFDIQKLSSKIWLTETLILDENTVPNDTFMLCSKLYRSEIDVLSLWNKTLFLDDFKFLASSVTKLDLKNVTITKNDGSIVWIDEILEFVPKLQDFFIYFNNDKSSSTFKNIAKLNDLVHLKYLFLLDIPEIFSVQEIFNFMNAHQNVITYLEFDNTVSEDYKNDLDDLINSIILFQIIDKIIVYDGQNEEKYKIMENLFC